MDKSTLQSEIARLQSELTRCRYLLDKSEDHKDRLKAEVKVLREALTKSQEEYKTLQDYNKRFLSKPK